MLTRIDGKWPYLRCSGLGRLLVLLLLPGCSADSSTGAPGDYPQRPIKLIIPFAPGGGTDTFGRIIKKAVDDEGLLAQPLVIVNIDGAGGTIGSRQVKNARADGYTMLLLHEALFTAQASGKVSFGAEAFTPIAGTGELGMVIVSAENSPFQSLGELMKTIKSQPDTVTFGANLGAITHYVGLALEAEEPGAKFRFVQSGGGAKRYGELKGGHIDVTGFSIEEYLRFREDGLRGLAYLGAERHPAAPELPTAAELGWAVQCSNTFYWWFPQHTPQEHVSLLRGALKRAMNTDFVQGKLSEMHCEPVFLEGDALLKRIEQNKREYAQMKSVQRIPLPNFPAIALVALAVLSVGAFRSKGSPRWDRHRLDRAAVALVLAWVSVYVVSLMLLPSAFLLVSIPFTSGLAWRMSSGPRNQRVLNSVLIALVTALLGWLLIQVMPSSIPGS